MKKDQNKKSKNISGLIRKTIYLLKSFGVPLDELTERRAERMAMVFLAVADIKRTQDFIRAKDINDGRSMKTRDIIKFVNESFEENISSGSYDDIRRKDLRLLVLGSIVLNTSPNSARNDSTRGYALNPAFAKMVKHLGTKRWGSELKALLGTIGSIKERVEKERKLAQIPITLSTGETFAFSPGQHNALQKKIIEDFLPRFGYGCEVLYIGDTADKFLFLNKKALGKLHFFSLSHGELPDVVAYSKKKNWLYLVEAVYSSGPISPLRMAELKKLVKDCTAEIIFVTTFLDRLTFRKFTADIAWESEVWIAENPDHLIHFNGAKFLGPYSE